MNDFTVDHFIEKFESIPEEEWCVQELANDIGQHCALGHCGCSPGDDYMSREALHLKTLFGSSALRYPLSVADVNDGYNSNYPQPSPKQRILAALRDIKTKMAAIEKQRGGV